MLTRWGRRLDPPAWDMPNVRAHFQRTLALPGVRRMVEEQGLELPRLGRESLSRSVRSVHSWQASGVGV